MAKRILALLTALLLISGALTAVAEEGDFFPLKEEITLTAFVMNTEGSAGTYDDNYVQEWIKEKTNINLEILYDVYGDDGKTKLTLLLYSNEPLPDIFISTRWSKAETTLYGSEGIIVPLNQYLESCETWNRLNEECPARRGDLTMTDGNIYTYGDINECYHCTHQARMWIYQPWVDSLNGGVLPTTTEELYDFLVKVKTMDPNGNGQADEIPMSGFIGGWASDPVTAISNSFVQNNNILSNTNIVASAGFAVKDGKVVYSLMTDEYQASLKYLNRLYQEGLLDPQTFTQNEEQFKAISDSQEHVLGFSFGGAMPQSSTGFWSSTPGAWTDWTCLAPLKGPDGVQYSFTSLNSYFGNCIGLVSSDCAYPEEAVRLFDLLASPEGTLVQYFGKEGVNWEWYDQGTSVSGEQSLYRSLTIDDQYKNADGTVDYSLMGFDYKNPCWGSDAMISARTLAHRNAESVEDPTYNLESVLYRDADLYEQYSPGVDALIPDLSYSEEQAAQVTEYAVSVGTYANQATVQFITGYKNIDSDWDAYIAEMNKMGAENYVSIVQAAYDAYLAGLNG